MGGLRFRVWGVYIGRIRFRVSVSVTGLRRWVQASFQGSRRASFQGLIGVFQGSCWAGSLQDL